MKLQKPHIIECEDGSLLLEWIKDSARFAICIEPDIYESSWYYVEKDGVVPQSDYLPLKMINYIMMFMEKESEK